MLPDLPRPPRRGGTDNHCADEAAGAPGMKRRDKPGDRQAGERGCDALERTRVKVNYKCLERMIHHFCAMVGVIPYANMAIEISRDGDQSLWRTQQNCRRHEE
jgi:hypothetical protein